MWSRTTMSDFGDNDTSEIALDLEIRCKVNKGADFNPEGIEGCDQENAWVGSEEKKLDSAPSGPHLFCALYLPPYSAEQDVENSKRYGRGMYHLLEGPKTRSWSMNGCRRADRSAERASARHASRLACDVEHSSILLGTKEGRACESFRFRQSKIRALQMAL